MLAALQRELADECRRGEGLYRELVFNNIFECCSRAFPIAKSRLGEEAWLALVDEFFANASCPSPQLWQMPKALVDYVTEPKLHDLLRFEWLEIEVHMMPDGPRPPVRPVDDPLTDPLVLNPDYRIEHYNYPVFRATEGDYGDYFVLAFRHPEQLNVHFIELGAVYVLAIEQLAKGPVPGGQLVDDREFFTELIAQGAVLGRTDESLICNS